MENSKLIKAFRDSGLPSKGGKLDGKLGEITMAGVRRLLEYITTLDSQVLSTTNVDIAYEYRKLREILTILQPRHANDPAISMEFESVMLSVYEHSSISALNKADYAEFLASAHKIIYDLKQFGSATLIALFIYYIAQGEGEEFNRLFYMLPRRAMLGKRTALIVQLAMASNEGNMPRSQWLLNELSDIPDSLKHFCLCNISRRLEDACAKSYLMKSPPTEWIQGFTIFSRNSAPEKL